MAEGRKRWVLPRGVRPADALLSLCLMVLALLLGWLAYSGLRDPGMGGADTGAPSPTTNVRAAQPVDVSAVAQYIDEHFAGADWYPAIVGYEPLEGEGVAVLTSLDRDGAESAVAICRAISFWRPGDDAPVLVLAADETPLAESPKGSLAQDCRARDKRE